MRAFGWMLLLVYVLVAAAYLLLRHVVMPDLDRWQPAIESALSDRLGSPVRLSGLSGHFEGFSPGVAAATIAVGPPQGEPAFSARDLQVVFNWQSLLRGKPAFEVLNATAVTLRIERLDARRFSVANHIITLPDADPRRRPAGLSAWQLPDWLVRQESIILPDVTVDFVDHAQGRHWQLRGANVESAGLPQERTLSVEVPAVDGLSGPLSIRAKLARSMPATLFNRLVGSLSKPLWQGEAWASVDDVQLPALAGLLGLPSPLASGGAGAQAWFRLVDSKPSDAQVEVNGQAWHFEAGPSSQWLSEVSAQTDLRWRGNGDLDVAIGNARFTDASGNEVALEDRKQLLTFRPDLALVKADISVRSTDAARALAVARSLPFLPRLRDRHADVTLAGRLERLDFRVDASADGAASYAIDADFSGLDVAFGPERDAPPLQRFEPRLPWGENLTGTLQMNERGGRLLLRDAVNDEVTESAHKSLASASEESHGNARATALGFPGIFAQPRILLDRLDADIGWQRLSIASDAGGAVSSPGVQIEIQRLQMRNTDARADISGTWRSIGESHRGVSDLQGRLTGADLTQLHRYLPLEIKPDVRRWVKDAIQAGRSDDIRFTLQGDLAHFPFRDPGRGEFFIESAFEKGRFEFLPEYPSFSAMDGIFRMERAGLSVKIDSARVFDSQVDRASFSIADLQESVLMVNLQTTGAAQEVVRYVNESPVHRVIDNALQQARIGGNAVTTLELMLPLHDTARLQVKGSTQLAGSSVSLASHVPPMNDVRGDIHWGSAGLSMDGLSVAMLGGKAGITAVSADKGHTRLTIRGQASAEGLRAEFDSPVTRSLRGQTTYTAAFELGKPGTRMTIDSDLAGMAIMLPDPVRKSAGQNQPLRIELRPTRLDGGEPARWGDRLTVRLGEQMQAIFEREPDALGRLRARRGALAIGTVAVLPDNGLSLDMETSALNADAWLGALGITTRADPATDADGPTDATATGLPADDDGYFAGFDFSPDEARIVTPSLIYARKTFTDVVLGATRTGRNWRANLSTREVNGYVQWLGGEQDEQARIVGSFNRLEIPTARSAEFENLLDTPITSLPSMDISAQEFILDSRAMGALQLRARNLPEGGWQIERLSLEHPAGRLAASGLWQRRDAGEGQTRLDIDLDLSDAGQMLAVYGMPDTLRGGSGKIAGQIGWRGSPVAPNVPSLEGRIDLVLGRGQFLRTDPGMAKLVGVLSLQSIPRRLSLDFSDVFEEGFAFDTIVGSALLEKGVATTDSILMNGVQAQVLLTGSADIFGETQDLSVRVRPTINAGIASIAYAALANPVVGIGTLIAQMILQQPLRELFSNEFRIEGQWSDPVVTEVERERIHDADNPVYIN